jgi:2-dehydro-3-deoxyphosphogluconate aldolase/(4S)-4-hydroxy-2-oxoglutarate aldolase
MNRSEVFTKIEESGVIAVIRLNDISRLEGIIDALTRGGINALEITMTTPDAIRIIEQLSSRYSGNFLIGAGTVLDPETARIVILAGVSFVVSPVLKTDLIHLVHRYDRLMIAGAFSPTEILSAWENGADAVKVFPATALGPKYFKDIHGPMPQIRLTPTGGVSIENAADFIRAGACCLGVGTALLDKKMIADSDWDGLAKRASEFVAAVKKGRS